MDVLGIRLNVTEAVFCTKTTYQRQEAEAKEGEEGRGGGNGGYCELETLLRTLQIHGRTLSPSDLEPSILCTTCVHESFKVMIKEREKVLAAISMGTQGREEAQGLEDLYGSWVDALNGCEEVVDDNQFEVPSNRPRVGDRNGEEREGEGQSGGEKKDWKGGGWVGILGLYLVM